MEQKFYICKHCGNIIAKVKDAGVPVVCCGEKMSEIIPNTTDAAVEKHLPVWTVENGVVHVKVSTVAHPMLPEHYIEAGAPPFHVGLPPYGMAALPHSGAPASSLRLFIPATASNSRSPASLAHQ